MAKPTRYKAENVLLRIEEKIKHWMRTSFDRTIGVSVQTLDSCQGDRRPQPSNHICREAYENVQLRRCCDESDQVMKRLAHKQETPFAYCCHKGLFNVVLRHFDTEITGIDWFVFLGQFAIGPIDKCRDCRYDHCTVYQRLLARAGIHIPSAAAISEVTRSNSRGTPVKPDLVFDGTFGGQIGESYVLDVGEVILCAKKAQEITTEEFRDANKHPAVRKNLIDYGERYRKAVNPSLADADGVHPVGIEREHPLK